MRTPSRTARPQPAATPRRRRLLAATAAALVVAATLAAGLATSAQGATTSGIHVTWRPRATPAPAGTWPSIRRTAETWCGSGETASDRTPQGSFSSSTIRVFYAVPSDVESRFAALANGIVTDVAAIDRWWQSQDGTRTPRWDTAPSGTCTGIPALDLGSVRLPRPASAYATEAGFSLLASDVGQSVGGSQKALVFFDGVFQDPDICGVSYETPTIGGRFGVASMALRSTCGVDTGAGGLVARVAVHELTHDLGAVEAAAPHACPDSGHVCDTQTDLMYPYVYSGSTLANAVLDPGRDDYYAHGGSWFDVQDSGWLAHLPRRTVTVSVTGDGRVTSEPSTIDCGSSCSAQLEDGENMTLTAVPTPPYAFSGWSGGCTGTGPCDLKPTADVAVQATFARPVPVLRVTIAGQGRVTSTPGGIACPGRCTTKVSGLVTLRATARAGWRLSAWKPACGRTTTCRVSVTRTTAVRAVFVRKR